MATQDADRENTFIPYGYEKVAPLLRSWGSTVKQYCDLHREFQLKENCWWHNERASISLLAGAAWRGPEEVGPWVALEEFGTSKRGKVQGSQVEGENSRNGRCDLYISNRNDNFAIEAKQVWQSIGRKSDGGTYVKEGLAAAWDDAGHLHSCEADYRFAVTFIVPFFPLGEVADDDGVDLEVVREKVDEWLNDMGGFERRAGKPVAYSYFFPYDCQDYTNEIQGRLFPGVVVVLEERVRGK